MEDNLIAIISLQDQLASVNKAARADVVDEIDHLLQEQFASSYPKRLANGRMQVEVEDNPNIQQFISYLESAQSLEKNDFQKFSQPERPKTAEEAQKMENSQLFDVRLFSFRNKAVSQQRIWDTYEMLVEMIENSNNEYVKEDQINTKTIIKFLTSQANKIFNHTKRESHKLPVFLRSIGLDFELTERNVLGFRNLCYGCFQEFKYYLLGFLEEFPLKECRLCVDDVVDFEVSVLGIEDNIIIIMRLVIFMINLEGICERIVASQTKDREAALNSSKTDRK